MTLINAAETSILQLLFENADWANIGDATGLQGSTAAGSFWISLHTADPTDTGSVTNEATYTGYARVQVDRGTGEWTVTDDTVVNDNVVAFPAGTGGSGTVTHFGIHTASSGAGNMILSGALNSSVVTGSGVTPEFAAGQLSATAA